MVQAARQDKSILLIGFMGTGKSAVAARLARLLDREVAELDALIEQREGRAISELFRLYGEPYFRDRESAMLEELAGRDGLVVSCGGGIVLRDKNVALLRSAGHVVLLTAEPETVYQRVCRGGDRPVLQGRMNPQAIAALQEERRPHYQKAAQITVPTDNRDLEEICREIIETLGLKAK